jgi:hypothetical protein
MDKPYLLRPWEIERLTDKQIIEIYYRKRDDKGNPIPYLSVGHEWLQRDCLVKRNGLRNEYEEFIKLGSVLGLDVNTMREAFFKKHGNPYEVEE